MGAATGATGATEASPAAEPAAESAAGASKGSAGSSAAGNSTAKVSAAEAGSARETGISASNSTKATGTAGSRETPGTRYDSTPALVLLGLFWSLKLSRANVYSLEKMERPLRVVIRVTEGAIPLRTNVRSLLKRELKVERTAPGLPQPKAQNHPPQQEKAVLKAIQEALPRPMAQREEIQAVQEKQARALSRLKLLLKAEKMVLEAQTVLNLVVLKQLVYNQRRHSQVLRVSETALQTQTALRMAHQHKLRHRMDLDFNCSHLLQLLLQTDRIHNRHSSLLQAKMSL